ncbi:hypothetical protein SAMN02910353_00689 [Ruminococcus sp. YRD2003]|nr:hypothetical protein SAMN02910353_00689 [Ruminococcus flavefaciens]
MCYYSISRKKRSTDGASADKTGETQGRNRPIIQYKKAKSGGIFVENCHFAKF